MPVKICRLQNPKIIPVFSSRKIYLTQHSGTKIISSGIIILLKASIREFSQFTILRLELCAFVVVAFCQKSISSVAQFHVSSQPVFIMDMISWLTFVCLLLLKVSNISFYQRYNANAHTVQIWVFSRHSG